MNSEFEPQIIPKHKRRFVGFDEKIIYMYGLWITTKNIQNHFKRSSKKRYVQWCERR